MTPSTIETKVQWVGAIQAGCPSAVNDYQNWMGGVDRHDQLRLQSYPLQMSTRFSTYYKSLLLAFLDLALVNAYLSHKAAAKIKQTVAMKRSELVSVLQNHLLQLKAEEFAGDEATPPQFSQKRGRVPVWLTHTLQQSKDWVTVSGIQKRRQWSYKVCALLRTDKKKLYAMSYFCERCSIDSAKYWLCTGQAIPPNLGKRVVLRLQGQNAGKRKKTQRELQLRRDQGSDGENSGDDDNDDNDE
ncbi:hypothetical protein F441_18712 [Phytophthora nicotianae CJ01A1]|uniref:PiggyBac transposable element-derived protein domain-containing protein n=1 Tax=Phytophthora nicotianae CJ01A1 TaxID=1317063 RepID=W2W4H4_PHYNI|nr:hypothetical protein F441_18712 [Phytophthora nicotianae CJ01A1]